MVVIRRGQHVSRATDVDTDEVLLGANDADTSSQVDDRVATSSGRVDCFVVTDVSKLLFGTVDACERVDKTPLEAHHSITAVSKYSCDSRANETGRPGDQNLHAAHRRLGMRRAPGAVALRPARTSLAHAATAVRSILALCRMSTGIDRSVSTAATG